MTVELKPEQERIIEKAIQAGLIRAAGDVVELGVEAIRQQLEALVVSGSAANADEWSRELHAWVNSHSTTAPLLSDDAISRESIYGGRGQ
ncbi:MAG TPA: hypothetical protein VJS43_14705 [Candidatus Acidoferrales bacterium]|nr:hypothetical protein [Candidatus Acidoferrales bacterium]